MPTVATCSGLESPATWARARPPGLTSCVSSAEARESWAGPGAPSQPQARQRPASDGGVRTAGAGEPTGDAGRVRNIMLVTLGPSTQREFAMTPLVCSQELEGMPGPPSEAEVRRSARTGAASVFLAMGVIALVVFPAGYGLVWRDGGHASALLKMAFSGLLLLLVLLPLLGFVLFPSGTGECSHWCSASEAQRVRLGLAQIDLTRDGSNLSGLCDHILAAQAGRLSRKQAAWLQAKALYV